MCNFDVVPLGTGSPLPDARRAGPSTLVRVGGQQLLVDCGRGVLMRLAGAGLPSPVGLSAVLLTHLHSDHTTDLNDVITSRWVMSPVPAPLTIVGPVGTATFVERTIAMLTDDIGYRIAHHDDLDVGPDVNVVEVADGLAWAAEGVRVLAAPTDHRPVHPTVGYRIEFENHVAALAGDTVPCDGLDRLCAGADVYVQTVVRRSLVEAVPFRRFQDILDYHSTTEDAGRTAAKAGVRTLVLTHCVPAPMPGSEGEYIADAAAHFAGEVLLPDDLDVIHVAG